MWYKSFQNKAVPGMFVSAGKFCQFIHTAAHWLSSPCLLLSLQQMVREGLNLLNLPPFLLCWLSPQYQIYTPIHNAALSVCPQCFQVTGWGAKWHHATKCHLAPFWCHAEPPRQLQAGLCASGLISGPIGAVQRGMEGAGTSLALATVCSIQPPSLSLSGGDTPKVCLCAGMKTQVKIHRFSPMD